MKRAGYLASVLMVWGMVCGCATRSDFDVSRYLRDMEMREQAATEEIVSGPDAPDTPISRLPPPSVGVPAGETADGDLAGGTLTIQPDCVVMVSVAEDSSLNGSYTVNNLGAVQLGYVGPVFLYNKTEREAARKIADVLRLRHFSKATVDVRILRASYDKVEITGSVNKPGIVQITAGDAISMHDLLLRAGGIQGAAGRIKLRVIRDGLQSPLKYSLEGEDYFLVDEDGNPRVPDVELANNDVVHVSTVARRADASSGTAAKREGVGPKTILVLGEVKKKGFVSFGAGEPCTMMRLLFRMGGLPPYAKAKAIRVLRRDADGFEEEFIVNAKAIMDEGDPEDDFILEDGDRVIVPARRISLF